MHQDNDDEFDKAMREATRGVIACLQTGNAPLLHPGQWSVQYRRAIAGAYLRREMLSGNEVGETVESIRIQPFKTSRSVNALTPPRTPWCHLPRSASVRE